MIRGYEELGYDEHEGMLYQDAKKGKCLFCDRAIPEDQVLCEICHPKYMDIVDRTMLGVDPALPDKMASVEGRYIHKLICRIFGHKKLSWSYNGRVLTCKRCGGWFLKNPKQMCGEITSGCFLIWNIPKKPFTDIDCFWCWEEKSERRHKCREKKGHKGRHRCECGLEWK